jgi:putative ABC transport system substrate-binding protein
VTAADLKQMDRPNLTGVTMAVSPELMGKRLSLLKSLLPGIRRVGVVFKPYGPRPGELDPEDIAAATTLGVELIPVPVEYGRIDPGLDAGLRHAIQGLFVGSSPGLEQPRYRDAINAWARRNRIATMHSMPVANMEGCVLAYGTNLENLTARVPYFVDRILRGARPADLPMEQPAKYELVANVRAARAIGLTIPVEILLQADRVIE